MVAVICLLLLGADRVNGQVTIQEEHVLSSSSWANGSGYSLSNVTCYRLESDITIENTFILKSGTAVFNLNGHKLILKETGYPLFDVRVGAHLYIWDVEVADDKTIVGGAVKGTGQLVGKHSTKSAIEVEGTLTFESGTITGFERSITLTPPDNVVSYGPAIKVKSTGVVNMTGGTITNCGFDINKHYSDNALAQKVIRHYGGAVYVEAGGTFNFSGGTISNCSAFRGGGVFLAGGTTSSDVAVGKGLNMSGSAKIHNCLATHRGGGVYVDAAAFPTIGGRNRFVLSGNAVIDNCKASSMGCGVFSKGIVIMTGGYITNNVPITGISNNSPAIWSGEPDYSQSVIMSSNAALGGGISIEGRDIDYDSDGNGVLNYDDVEQNIYPSLFTMSGGEIRGNIGGSGGGIMAYNNSSLQVGGNASITGNHAIGSGGTGNGGGIYVQSSSFTFASGTVSGNYARRYGGGINVNAYGGGAATVNLSGSVEISGNYAGYGGGVSQETGECNMTLDESVKILNNTARGIAHTEYGNYGTGGNGGGIFILSGNLVIESGTVSGNTAKGDGGGVTLRSGTIEVNSGNIENNTATNGGGISLENGTITVSGNSSYFKNNRAVNYGGGLYVANSLDGSQKSVTFSGGTFEGNRAVAGGGICVSGNINLTASATNLKNNAATNGGGVYLLNGGKGTTSMTYTGGIITGNTATGIPQNQTTAYKNDANNMGVGGGVYLSENTSLTLNISGEVPLGLYGNSASFAADDIYANGKGTNLLLPNVSKMSLQGFNVPTSELYWVEDYVTGDTSYGEGTAVGGPSLATSAILRYKKALSTLKPLHKIDFQEDVSKVYNEKYVCLALGYDLYYVTLIKKGLQVGESAVFNISYKKDGVWYPYRTISFPCVNDSQKGDGGVRTIVLLPAGTWKFEENAEWSWKYDTTPSVVDLNGNEVDMTDGVTINAGSFELLGEGKTFMYTFTNTSNNSTVKSDEAVIVNKLIVQ